MSDIAMARVPVVLRLLLGCAPLAFSTALAAQAVDSGIDVSVSASASNNPYLIDDSSSWVGVGNVEVRPWVRRRTERDSITLQGLAQFRAFTGIYDVESTFGGLLDVRSRLNERTTAYGTVGINSTNRRTPFGAFGARPGLVTPSVPGAVPGDEQFPINQPIVVLPDQDVALLGQTGRSTTISINTGLSRTISERTQANYQIGFDKLIVNQNGQGVGYSNVSGGATLSRTLDARTRVGATATAGFTRYEGNRPGATSLSALANASHQISRYWTISGSVGVSATQADGNAVFPSYSTVSPAGSVQTCYQPPRERLCASYSRSQLPSAAGEVRNTDSAGLEYSMTFSERRRLDVSIGYSRSSANQEAASRFRDLELLNTRATYSQTLNDRLDGYIFGAASRSYGDFLSREPSIEFGVGVRLRIGDRT